MIHKIPSLGHIRFVTTIITLLAFAFYYFAPPKVVVLESHRDLLPSLFSDSQFGGKSEAKWLDFENSQWECVKRHSNIAYPICGVSFSIINPRKKNTNFAVYDFMYLYFSHDKTVDKIKVHVRNHNLLYSIPEDASTQKPNSIIIKTEEIKDGRVKIDFGEFNVGDWWVEQFDIPRSLIKPEFKNVKSFSIETTGTLFYDQPQQLGFEKVALVGKWVSFNTLSLTFVCIWVVILAADSFRQIYLLYRKSKVDSKRVEFLTDYTQTLKDESNKYRELSMIDPLTGLFNRYGLATRVDAALFRHRNKNRIGVIIFDVDYFKSINDSFGHDFGDEILKELANLVNSCLRENDTLARWGGEEFVVLFTVREDKNIAQIGEKIRQSVQEHLFGLEHPKSITISLGATIIREHEPFENAFKRADTALYEAKSGGRNRLAIA